MSNDPVRTRQDFWEVGPFCRNCELTADDIDPDIPVYFCSPACAAEFESREPLKNFLGKRARRKPAQGF